MYSFRNLLKQVHLYLFLFALCEIAYGGMTQQTIMPQVRKVVLVLGIVYSAFYFGRMPFYMRVMLASTAVLLLYLVGESLDRYGVWFESVNFTSQILYPVIAGGAFVACVWMGNVRMNVIIGIIIALFCFNQLVLGRITEHHFNSEERSMTAAEAYYLVLPLIYSLNVYLLQGRVRFLYYALALGIGILASFHRTVWVTSLAAVVMNWFFIRTYIQIKASNILTQLAPVLMCAILFICCLFYVKPELTDNLISSFSDIQNANNQGTGGWRSEQRDIYMSMVPEHPFLGWTYEGYDKGEVMATAENEEWRAAKGTFIHSGYIYFLYNFGLVGLLLQYGFILITLIQLHRIFDRQDAGQWALLIFICSSFVYAWSYQLPDFFWGFAGIAIYLIYQANLMARWRQHPLNMENVQQPELEAEIA
ncbi:O-antigen ligase family protein [Fibrella sp. HMF5335]|uniref:O-antigen ligase family protein n=1 Tax=Fibrella rubiginis TaxID=2817060 RepID=A0A939GKB1_9BACT|nr:O-antigen ligase family protein [Fibrella rubiginis]MBO0938819.1 O-antigen ligase family protein [Fibrella rubiginis]